MRMFCTYTCLPVTLSGMSTRGTRTFVASVYSLTGFDGAWPGLMLAAAIRTLNTLSPSSPP